MKRFSFPLLFILCACNAGSFYDKEYVIYDPAERRREREELAQLRLQVAAYEKTPAAQSVEPVPVAESKPVAETGSQPKPDRKAQIEAELDQLTARIRNGEDSDGSLSRRRTELETELVGLRRTGR